MVVFGSMGGFVGGFVLVLLEFFGIFSLECFGGGFLSLGELLGDLFKGLLKGVICLKAF